MNGVPTACALNPTVRPTHFSQTATICRDVTVTLSNFNQVGTRIWVVSMSCFEVSDRLVSLGSLLVSLGSSQ